MGDKLAPICRGTKLAPPLGLMPAVRKPDGCGHFVCDCCAGGASEKRTHRHTWGRPSLNTLPPYRSHARPARRGYHPGQEAPGRKSTPPGIPARRKVSLFRRPPGVHIWNSAGSPAGPDPPKRAVPSPCLSPHGERIAGPHGGDLPRSSHCSPAADTDVWGRNPQRFK